MRLTLLTLLMMGLTGGGWAACTSPAGDTGHLIYNQTYKVLQYCTGTAWRNMGNKNQGGGTGPCTSPSGVEGTVIFNSSDDLMQYCNGDNWINTANWASSGHGATFSPAGIAGLTLWLKADALALNDNDPVTSWPDSGPNGLNASAYTGNPVFKATGYGTSPTVFLGGASALQTANVSFDDFSVFIVFMDAADTNSYERLLDHDYTNGFWLGRNDATAGSWGGGIMEASAPYGIYATLTDGQAGLLESVRSNTTHLMYANGNTPTTNTVSGATTASNPLAIGAWYANNTPGQRASNIHFMEILVYNNDLSDSEREKVEGYLAHKWGLQSKLPGGHPYKSAPPL